MNDAGEGAGLAAGWDADIPGVWERVWSGLCGATGEPGHPWRTPVLATAGDGGDARVVVVRGIDRGGPVVEFHTDSRSPKVGALRADPRVTFVFYDPGWQVQVRVGGRARVHVGDELAAAAWLGVPGGSRVNYATSEPPGSPLAGPVEAHDFRDAFRYHFALVRVEVERVDWLCLRAAGHRRIRWERGAAGWAGGWVGP